MFHPLAEAAAQFAEIVVCGRSIHVFDSSPGGLIPQINVAQAERATQKFQGIPEAVESL